MPWQLTHETPSDGSTPAPRTAGPTAASGAWQTMQRGLVAGFPIASASAIRAEREVVSVAKDRECTSRWDQTTNSFLRSAAPPWQPLAEQEAAPSATPSAGGWALASTARPTSWIRPNLIVGRMIIGLAWSVNLF